MLRQSQNLRRHHHKHLILHKEKRRQAGFIVKMQVSRSTEGSLQTETIVVDTSSGDYITQMIQG